MIKNGFWTVLVRHAFHGEAWRELRSLNRHYQKCEGYFVGKVPAGDLR